MTLKTEADVMRLQAEMQEVKAHVMQVIGVLNAVAERVDALEGHPNAVVEGDEIRPAKNGKIKAKTHR